MLEIAFSLILTGLLLALPVMTWQAYKAKGNQSCRIAGKTLPRLLAACTIAAWAAQVLRYALLAAAQNPIEARQAIHLSAPLGWLVWLAALAGLVLFAIIFTKAKRP